MLFTRSSTLRFHLPLVSRRSAGKQEAARLPHRKFSWVIHCLLLFGIFGFYSSANNAPSALAAGSPLRPNTVLGQHSMSPISNSSHVTRNATTNDPPCTNCGTGPLVPHSGPVQHHPRVYLVFWGNKWLSDPDYVIPVVQTFFQELAGGDYNNILSQYTDNPSDPNSYVHNDVVLAGTWIDTSAVPYFSGTAQLLNEAGRAMSANNWSNSPDTQVIVFPQDGTSYGFPEQCGEHDYGTDATGRPLVVGLVYYSTYTFPDSKNCDFSKGVVNQSMTRAAAHEYAEAATDPEPGFNTAWRASDGSEIGDLCNTVTFYYTPVDYGYSIFTQELWDNRAYQANNAGGCSTAEGQEYYVAPPRLKHTVQGGILGLYQANGANTGFLALPLTEQMPTVDGSVVSYFSGSGCGNGGGYGEHSAVFAVPSIGTSEMHGCIYEHFIGIDAENGQYYINELGVPTSSEMDAPGGGRVNYFYGSSAYSWCGSTGPNWSHAAIYWNGSSAYAVKGCMYNYYQNKAGGPAGSMGLGLPSYEEQALNGGHIQTFAGSGCGTSQGSAIYDGSGTGVHAVKGCIYYYYNHSYTGTYGAGFPTSDELSMGGGHGQHFASGGCGPTGNGIYDGPGTGVHQVVGCIYQKYLGLNEANSYLGFPTYDETGVSTGRVSYFGGTTWGSNCGSYGLYNSHAAIYWSSGTGAHEVHGCLYDSYVHSYSGPDGMGFPTTDQMSMGGGYGQDFANGMGLYDGPGSGIHMVHGAIWGEYNYLGEADSFLGFPTTDEVGVSYGRANYFTGTTWGSNCGNPGPFSSHAGIFWTGSTGAHEVHGCMYDTYNLYGGPGGSLGFPNSDEYVPAGGGHEQTFEHGYIYDSPTGDIHAYICPPSC